MAAGKKTGGRKAGTPNKPKVSTEVDTDASTTVATPQGGAADSPPVSPSRARAREAESAGGLKIRYELLDKLRDYDRNANQHPAAQIALIERLLSEFGWTTPMGKASGVLIYGHARRQAARNLRDKGIAIPGNPDPNRGPVVDLSHLSKEQRRAYVIADNESARKSTTNEELLALELTELRELGFDLSLTGLDLSQITSLLGGDEGLTDPDEAPPRPEVPVSMLGDVWLLGRHRVACGDSRSKEVVAAALSGAKPHLMVTDPPYGVDYDADWRNRAVMIKGEQKGDHGSRATGKVTNDDQADWRDSWALFTGSVAYVWHSGLHGQEVVSSLSVNGFKVRAQIIWVKIRPVISRGHYHWQHEPALYGVREGEDDQWRFEPDHDVADYAVRAGATGQWQGGRRQSTVWNIEHLKSDTGHSTQKPVECMKRPIENNSIMGQEVYDPFLGSGTTVIAAQMTGRVCLGCELDRGYVDVIVQRWQAFVGESATLESDGRTFAEVAAERAAPKAAKVRARLKAVA